MKPNNFTFWCILAHCWTNVKVTLWERSSTRLKPHSTNLWAKELFSQQQVGGRKKKGDLISNIWFKFEFWEKVGGLPSLEMQKSDLVSVRHDRSPPGHILVHSADVLNQRNTCFSNVEVVLWCETQHWPCCSVNRARHPNIWTVKHLVTTD